MMLLGAIFAGYIILHQQVTAKPWNYPPGFVSDFHENIHNMVSETGHRDRQAQSRSGVAQLSQGYAKTEIDKEWLFIVSACKVQLRILLKEKMFLSNIVDLTNAFVWDL